MTQRMTQRELEAYKCQGVIYSCLLSPDRLVQPMKMAHEMTLILHRALMNHPRFKGYYGKGNHVVRCVRHSEKVLKVLGDGAVCLRVCPRVSHVPTPMPCIDLSGLGEIDSSSGLELYEHHRLSKLLDVRRQALCSIAESLFAYCRISKSWEVPLSILINGTGILRTDLQAAIRHDAKRMGLKNREGIDTGEWMYMR